MLPVNLHRPCRCPTASTPASASCGSLWSGSGPSGEPATLYVISCGPRACGVVAREAAGARSRDTVPALPGAQLSNPVSFPISSVPQHRAQRQLGWRGPKGAAAGSVAAWRAGGRRRAGGGGGGSSWGSCCGCRAACAARGLTGAAPLCAFGVQYPATCCLPVANAAPLTVTVRSKTRARGALLAFIPRRVPNVRGLGSNTTRRPAGFCRPSIVLAVLRAPQRHGCGRS